MADADNSQYDDSSETVNIDNYLMDYIECVVSSPHTDITSENDSNLSESEADGNGDTNDCDLDLDEDCRDEEEEGWREWREDDVSLPEFEYLNDSGFKPPPNMDRDSQLQYFQLFFTDELIKKITMETNRYAKEKIKKTSPLQQRSVWHSWTNVTLSEMKAFIGVVLNMGLNPKPEMKDFFSNDWLDYQPFFKNVFSKNRFFQIFWCLYMSPPSDDRPSRAYTRSNKVMKVIHYLENRFRAFFCPSRFISMDESTIGFKGTVEFKAYNKAKLPRCCIKMFVLSDSINGYVCAMEPYLGRETTDSLARPDLLVTSRVVLHLVDKLEKSYGSVKGLHIFSDRYYTSIELANELYHKNVHLTGTIDRRRRGLPINIKKKKKITKGNIIAFRKDDNLSALEWMDRRPVLMLSTLYNNKIEVVKRKGVQRRGVPVDEIVEKPSMICRYNEYTRGVYLADQYIASYSFTRRSVKWWRKVFFWLLEVAVVNSFILFNSNRSSGYKVTRQRQFRKDLIKQLIGETRNVRKTGRPVKIDDEERLNGKLHIPDFLAPQQTKECAVCSNRSRGERRRTRMFCSTCTTNPGLHPGSCFKKYHTLKIFKPA